MKVTFFYRWACGYNFTPLERFNAKLDQVHGWNILSLYKFSQPYMQTGCPSILQWLPILWGSTRKMSVCSGNLIQYHEKRRFHSPNKRIHCGGSRKVDVRLPESGNSNCNGARPVHLIITMMKWIRTSRLSINKSLSLSLRAGGSYRIHCGGRL